MNTRDANLSFTPSSEIHHVLDTITLKVHTDIKLSPQGPHVAAWWTAVVCISISVNNDQVRVQYGP